MTLSPLYFSQQGGASLRVTSDAGEASLAPELLSRVAAFGSWGDLAKLAQVQRSWSTILTDATENRPALQWELAQALLHGTDGLAAHPQRAMELLRTLAVVETNEYDTPVLPSDDDDDEENSEEASVVTTKNNDTDKFCAPAMKAIANCYLEGLVDSDDEKNIQDDNEKPNDDDDDATLQQQKANTTKGLAWLKASHILGGDADAAHQIALVFEYGQYGQPIDVVVAAEWLTKAAEQGHLEAMAELGLCYELGCGVEACDTTALDWYVRAANEGHLTSQYSVGEMYEEARGGVPQSDEEACLWYYKAAVKGDEDSRKALQRLEDIARIVLPSNVRTLLNE